MHPLYKKADELSLNIPLGLIINFNELKMTDGEVPIILPAANR